MSTIRYWSPSPSSCSMRLQTFVTAQDSERTRGLQLRLTCKCRARSERATCRQTTQALIHYVARMCQKGDAHLPTHSPAEAMGGVPGLAHVAVEHALYSLAELLLPSMSPVAKGHKRRHAPLALDLDHAALHQVEIRVLLRINARDPNEFTRAPWQQHLP